MLIGQMQYRMTAAVSQPIAGLSFINHLFPRAKTEQKASFDHLELLPSLTTCSLQSVSGIHDRDLAIFS
jgi:hypothetical protein